MLPFFIVRILFCCPSVCSNCRTMFYILASLVVPFLRLGEVISGGPHFPLTSEAMKKVLTGRTYREVDLINHRSCGRLSITISKLIASLFRLSILRDPMNMTFKMVDTGDDSILVILYIIFLPCCKLLVHKFSPVPSSPKKPLHPHMEFWFHLWYLLHWISILFLFLFLEKPISLWSDRWFGFENIALLPLCRTLVELVVQIVDYQKFWIQQHPHQELLNLLNVVFDCKF